MDLGSCGGIRENAAMDAEQLDDGAQLARRLRCSPACLPTPRVCRRRDAERTRLANSCSNA